MLSTRPFVVALLLSVTIAGGCGGDDDEPAARSVIPTATATATPVPSTTPTPVPSIAPTATATPTPDEGGDEAGNRFPLSLTLAAEDVVPARAEVPAFLGLRLLVRNESGRERIVKLAGRTVLEVLPGEEATADLEGLQPGEHVFDAGESGRAAIVARRAG